MHLARLARLDDEAAARARALADQVMVHGAGGQQARDRRVLARRRRGRRGSRIVAPSATARDGCGAELVERRAQARRRRRRPGSSIGSVTARSVPWRDAP